LQRCIDFLIDFGDERTFQIVHSLKPRSCLFKHHSIDSMCREHYYGIVIRDIINRFDKRNSSIFKIFSDLRIMDQGMYTKNLISWTCLPIWLVRCYDSRKPIYSSFYAETKTRWR